MSSSGSKRGLIPLFCNFPGKSLNIPLFNSDYTWSAEPLRCKKESIQGGVWTNPLLLIPPLLLILPFGYPKNQNLWSTPKANFQESWSPLKKGGSNYVVPLPTTISCTGLFHNHPPSLYSYTLCWSLTYSNTLHWSYYHLSEWLLAPYLHWQLPMLEINKSCMYLHRIAKMLS